MLATLRHILSITAACIALCTGCFLMLLIVTGYTEFRDDVQFLRLKHDYLDNPVWKAAFYIHVFSAIFALFAGFTQFSKNFLTQYRTFHRFIGKLYVWDILAINAPTGMILAICANGGMMGKSAFILLDVLWFYFTLNALISAKNRDFVSHRNYMIRSYALTLSAITLRTWKVVLARNVEIDPTAMYIIEAWMGFMPNLILAELIIRYTARGKLSVPSNP